jgi:hypothetical protein
MSYRFLKLTTIYEEHLNRFLSQNPGCKNLSYADLYQQYVSTHFGWADYYPRILAGMGHETLEVFSSFELMQKAWARENAVKYSRNWFSDIVFAQVRRFQPDVLFIEDMYTFDRGFRRQLREICLKQPVIIGYRGAPTDDFAALKDVDLLLTCSPHFAERMRSAGAEVATVPHAFQPDIVKAVGPLNRDLAFTFSGSLVLRDGFHNQRYDLLDRLLASTPLQIWASISQSATSSSRAKSTLQKMGRGVRRILKNTGFDPERNKTQLDVADGAFQEQSQNLSPSHPWIKRGYTNRLHQPVFGLANFRMLARSKLTFNNHIDCAEDYAGNSRLFEATGMGAALITDWKSNLAELFELDSEIVAYKSAEECSEKVNYLLDHPSELEAIAQAGQRRTLENYTFVHRAAQLDELIRQRLV